MENENLVLNKHIYKYMLKGESGLIAGTENYDTQTYTLNTNKWGGRAFNFNIDNLGKNKLIVGDRCYLSFRCSASKSDGTVVNNDAIEIRDEAGNILVESVTVNIAGTQVHTDGNADITRHFYERLSKTNSSRVGNADLDRFIGPDASSFKHGTAPNFYVNGGIYTNAIQDGREFDLVRPLTDIAFFGPRDSAIPASLPISLNFRFNSNTARMFNVRTSITDEPLLYIQDVKLHIATVDMNPSLATDIEDRLNTSGLPAVSDSWATQSLGPTVAGGTSEYRTNTPITYEITPDILGVAMFPQSVYNAPIPFTGPHYLRTSWNTVKNAVMRSSGVPIRTYSNLQGTGEAVGTKVLLAKELSNIATSSEVVGLGGSPIDTEVFINGYISFFPAVFRTITEETVLPPKPFTMTFDMTLETTSVSATIYAFRKLRHQWLLSNYVGLKTQIEK